MLPIEQKLEKPNGFEAALWGILYVQMKKRAEKDQSSISEESSLSEMLN